ncbi:MULTISPECIES: Rieske (2Fe-2S) protein [Kordiimonas]|jgi:nitrite reductase/ring-hydroxylating ferredoxin subunit|uniref:Rieske (2Fe-2S) protein n=1 Tax=Kordiimonas TaxID=288021 RepID=UPI00257DB29E|nr:Rieske 2Fe-2S domain-containing protein [Kordiimonas sp. UBA4487]
MEKPEAGAGKDWKNLGQLAGLKETGRHVLKLNGKQIALLNTEAGLFAINNRCPHEGYPLVEGTLNDSCTLACNWHGWAFDLKSGEALQGRDAVRTYPVERRGKDIWIDLTPVPNTVRAAKAFDEMDEAMAEHDYERIARSLCRLDQANVTYEDVAKRVISWSLSRFERGFGHAHAGLADWIDLAGDDDDLRLVAFLEAFGNFSWDALFSQPLELPAKAAPWGAKAFLKELEAMNSLAALGRVRGAFEAGLRFRDIKPAYLDFIFSHYAGFGHPAIYVTALERLSAKLGAEVEETLALQLAHYLCVAAREDLIPEFRGFADYLRVEPGSGPVPKAADLVGASVRQTMAVTASSLARPEALYEALLGASALNMLGFDLELQHAVKQPIARNIGWLDFTHAITFAEAVHTHASENAGYWQSGLMQMACFVGRNSAYVGEVDLAKWRVTDKRAFLAQQKAALFNMDEGEYIYGVHRLKMMCAVARLDRIVSEATSELVFAALNRYLHTRLRQRHPARAAYQARQSVLREG